MLNNVHPFGSDEENSELNIGISALAAANIVMRPKISVIRSLVFTAKREPANTPTVEPRTMATMFISVPKPIITINTASEKCIPYYCAMSSGTSKKVFLEFLRPHRTIPHTTWAASHRWDLSLRRTIILCFGLFIFGLGDSLLVQSATGNAPWTVLAQGVSKKLDISLGMSTFAISALILLLWIPLREKPGFGTIANIVIIASAIQLGVNTFPLAENLIIGIVMDFLGIAMVGMGSALYITCALGPGPRDGLMTAIHKRTGVRVGRVRFGIESTVLVLGALLGGTIGVGTALFALFIGQSIAVSLGVVSRFTSQ